MKGWTGGHVTKARKYWATKIMEAEMAGDPLMCSFHGRDKLCPGPVLITDTWHVDHINPRAEGGRVRDPRNQHPAHASCNSRAGAQMTNKARGIKDKKEWSW